MTAKVQMNQTYADAALVAFGAVADAQEVDWCLYAGTCLGLYRDGRYLPDDNDLDVAVKTTPERLDALWGALEEAGFKLGRFCNNADGTLNRHLYFHPMVWWPDAGGTLVDVFYTFTAEEQNLTSWYDGVYYREQLLLVPHPVELYLQAAYGEWWDKSLRNSAKGKEDARTI